MYLKQKENKMGGPEFESKITDLYEIWLDYERRFENGINVLPEIEKLQTHVRTIKEDYAKSINIPSYMINITERVDTFLYKTKVLKPLRDIMLSEERSTYRFLITIGSLERFVNRLYKKAKDSE